ncbi:MAG: diphosphatase [Frankiales bacterium]|nr:diphosphatase [Frankiales bacterium]
MSLPALSRATVDRDAALREDGAGLEKAWESSEVLVIDDQGRALVEGTDLVLVRPAEAPEGDRFYLGGGRYFAVRGPLPRKLGTVARNLRDVGHLLGDRDAGLMVHAVGLANWHATHTHCPRCGAPTRSVKGGAVRVCDADGTEHFPRTDPAMIVLVHDGADRCLLGRQPIWPAGRYSTLAGFVEPGESAEQAVVREVREETGVVVRDVAYSSSQPWPFPASLMLGFTARADGDAEPVATDGELEDARWFHRDELRDGSAMLPTPVSIAYKLITDWVSQG